MCSIKDVTLLWLFDVTNMLQNKHKSLTAEYGTNKRIAIFLALSMVMVSSRDVWAVVVKETATVAWAHLKKSILKTTMSCTSGTVLVVSLQNCWKIMPILQAKPITPNISNLAAVNPVHRLVMGGSPSEYQSLP